MTPSALEFRRYRITIEIATPREDFISRLLDRKAGVRCRECEGVLADGGIYVNSEGASLDPTSEERFCSWRCLAVAAASTCVTGEDADDRILVEEIPDWRGRRDGEGTTP